MSDRSPRRPRVTRSRADRTRLGVALGVVALLVGLACIPLTLFGVGWMAALHEVFPMVTLVQGLALSSIATLCLVGGGVGVLLLRPWGWWSVLAGATLGWIDQLRFYGPLAGALNPDHPQAAETAASLLVAAGIPGGLYFVLLVLLLLPSVRRAYRVSAAPRPPRRGNARRGAELDYPE